MIDTELAEAVNRKLDAWPVNRKLDAWPIRYLEQHEESQHPSKEVCVPQESSCCTGSNQDERAEPDILRAGAQTRQCR